MDQFVKMFVATVGLMIAVPVSALEPGDVVDNFRLIDSGGISRELYYYSNRKAVVLMIHASACSTMRPAMRELDRVAKQFTNRGVEFLLMNSSLEDTRASVVQEAKSVASSTPS